MDRQTPPRKSVVPRRLAPASKRNHGVFPGGDPCLSFHSRETSPLFFRAGSHDAEEDAARAVDRRLRSWNRDDECNFTVDGEERPLEERKRGGSASKRRAPGGSGGGARKKQQTDSAGRDANPKRLRVAASRDDDDDQEPEDDDDDDDEHEPYDLLDRPSGFGALAPLSGDVLVLADKDKQEATKPPPQPHHDADDDDDARGAPLSDRGAGEAATANV